MEEKKREVLIKVDKLWQKRGKKIVLQDLTFTLHKEECLGIFGLRGSGKSTLLHILAGLDRFQSGMVEVLGCNIRQSQEFKRKIGLVTQESSLFRDLNVVENLDFIATLKDASRQDMERVIELMELKDFLREPLSRLNVGIYQRLSLACAMLNSPQILILDEVIKDIDLYSRHIIMKELKKFLNSGGACVFAFSDIELCDFVSRVGWLDEGRLFFYEPQAARKKWNSLIESYTQ